MTAFRLSKVTKVYGSRTVLSIPHLEIEKGGSYSLLGPNGAGKTTLLSILGFLEPPTTGTIYYENRPVKYQETVLQKYRREAVILDQQPILFSTSVYKNIEFGLKIRKISHQSRKKLIADALEMVGMRSFSAAPAHRLSGGETQRVALARALVLSPKILLCDEPTASVDVEHQGAIVSILKEINTNRNITVIFTTHDRTLANRLSSKTLMLDRGRLTEDRQVNIFSATRDSDTLEGGCYAITNGFSFKLSAEPKHGMAKKIRFSIDPKQIELLPPDTPPGEPNWLRGRVHRIEQEAMKIHVVVDAGVWISATLDPSVYRSNQIIVGDDVDCHIPPEAIRIIDIPEV